MFVCSAAQLGRSAGCQPAASQVANLRRSESLRRPADRQSALQEVGSLRYARRLLPPRIATISSLALISLLGALVSARAAGPHGVDVGWTVDHNSGQLLFTSALASQIAQGEAGWVRVEMSLVSGHSTWDATMFGYYDTVVNNAKATGLQILMLIDTNS